MDTVVRFISSLFPFYLFILIFGRERESCMDYGNCCKIHLWRNIDGMKMIYVPLTLFFLIYGMWLAFKQAEIVHMFRL